MTENEEMMKREGWVGIKECWFGMEGGEDGTGGRDREMLVWDGRMWGGDTDTSPSLSFAPHSLVIHLLRNLKNCKKENRTNKVKSAKMLILCGFSWR